MNDSEISMQACLLEFASLCNSNTDLHKLIRKWERHVHVEPKDGSTSFTLTVEGGAVTQVTSGKAQGKQSLTISGPTDVLLGVFSGRINPAEALISMGLETYGAEEDVMKLDAITLILWDW